MPRLIELTVPISPGMAAWPDDPAVNIEKHAEIARGAEANVSRYCLGSHSGTHVDPPCHFLPGGMSIDQLPLEWLVGPAQVLDLENVVSEIGAGDLETCVNPGTDKVLLKTRNSRLWDDPEQPFRSDFVSLSLKGARWLVERGVRLVGIDYLSIEAFGAPGHPVHRLLLAANVVVVEGLDLRCAVPGRYQLVVLPMRVRGGDGGPARAFLSDLSSGGQA